MLKSERGQAFILGLTSEIQISEKYPLQLSNAGRITEVGERISGATQRGELLPRG